MKNIDKIKISLGEVIFNFISYADRALLLQMKEDIQYDIDNFFDSYDNSLQQKRLDEQWLINYRLS